MQKNKLFILLLFCSYLLFGNDSTVSKNEILFVSFKDPGNTGIYYALSDDGLNFKALNKGNPVLLCSDSIPVMRDPFIVRDIDQGYHMVWTVGKHKIGYAWSPDLIEWSKHRIIPIDASNENVLNTWAPELVYDEKNKEWCIIYSSTILGQFPETVGQVKNNKNHRIYAVSTTDFKTVSKPKLIFDPGYPVIDATLLKEGDSYLMVFKDERDYPLKKQLKTAVAQSLYGPWTNVSDTLTPSWSEGPTAIKWNGSYFVYYDFYNDPQHMGLLVSNDFKKWDDVTNKTDFPHRYKHGCFIVVSGEEATKLRSKFLNEEKNIPKHALVVDKNVATFYRDTIIGKKFKVPDSWDKILIKENVTLIGSFFMPKRNKPIEIAGESRETSIIKGDGSRPEDDGKKGRTYSAIRCDSSPDLYVHDLRSLDPMKFHIHGGFGNVTVERCDLIEQRGTHTTDGVHGGKGKTIVKDCYINTFDDATYISECKLIENTTIVHNQNGSPFMVSWGYALDKNTKCVIRNCTVISNDAIDYHHGIIGWAGNNGNDIDTMHVVFEGTFKRLTNPGKTVSPMYTIGRLNKSPLNNCVIEVQGLCPYREEVEIRSNANSNVIFRNCKND